MTSTASRTQLNQIALALLTVLTIVLLAAAPRAVYAQSEADIVQGQVKAMLHATYAGDVDAVLLHTHPLIIELLGGQEASREMMTAALAPIARLEMKVENLNFPQAPIFFKGTERRYVFVPTLLTVSTANGKKLESLNYQLGILERGSSAWKYVEGSRVNQSNARQLFSDFPTDVEFPQFYRKTL